MKKKKIFKKLLLIFIFFIIIVSAGIIYLNEIFLPQKIKILIINSIEQQTQKKASLDSIQFHILRGIVLNKFTLYDNSQKIISADAISAAFMLLPFIKERKIIIPAININSPKIYLERKADNTFNLQELLFSLQSTRQEKLKFDVIITRINIKNGHIDFKDLSLSPAFDRSVTDINLIAFLSLPYNVKFILKARTPDKSGALFSVSGTYNLVEKQLSSNASISGLNPANFRAYLARPDFLIEGGKIDAAFNILFKENILNIQANGSASNISFIKMPLRVNLNSAFSSNLSYGLENKVIDYSADINLKDTNITGIDKINSINNINGLFHLTKDRLTSKNITADALNIPINASLEVKDFSSPVISIDTASQADISVVQGILADRLKINLPLAINGQGKFALSFMAKNENNAFIRDIRASADISGGSLKFRDFAEPITKINGHLDFDTTSANWKNMHFSFQEKDFVSEGTVNNFAEPQVQAKINSDELSANASFAVENKNINIESLKANYLDSKADISGTIDTSNPDNIHAVISSKFSVNIDDAKIPIEKYLAKYKEAFNRAGARGVISGKMDLKGNIKDFKNCALNATVTSPAFSVYGYSGRNLLAEINQSDGIINIPLLSLGIYGGGVQIDAKINYSQNQPFSAQATITNVNIEELKKDTPIKNQDISGTLNGQAKIDGFLTNLEAISGSGKILVNEGKLWHLDLFKGIGQILFTKDFANIVFSEAYCEFFIKDRAVISDNIKLSSQPVNLQGSAKLEFDGSINAVISTQVSETAIEDGKTISFRDITTAIIGQATRFGVIKLSGTVKEPKFSFEPTVRDVIKSLKDLFLPPQ